MNEIWDAYDRHFDKIEAVNLIRGEPIPDGLYHLVCDVAVRHADGTYLLMQRDWKKHLGGLWELTAGGSALSGETPLSCAMRELREETGVVSCSWREIGRMVHDERHTLYVEYLCITDGDKNAVTLQKGETIAYQWVDSAALFAMVPDALASDRTRRLLRESGL